MFETKSTPCLRQASGPSALSVGGQGQAQGAEPVVAGAAGGGGGAPLKTCSSYTPLMKSSSGQQAKEPPRSQSELRGGPRQHHQSSQSARMWRPGSGSVEIADGGKPGITSSASAGKFPAGSAAAAGAAAGGTAGQGAPGGQAAPRSGAAADGGAKRADTRPLGSEAFERLASGGRRNDVERPKSLKAAEQVRLQEEQRQQAKLQEEELRQQAKQQQQQQQQQQQERERRQREPDRDRERAKAAAAAIAAAVAPAPPADALVGTAVAAGAPAAAEAAPAPLPPTAGGAAADEREEPEVEASVEPQPVPEPADVSGASSAAPVAGDVEDESAWVAVPPTPVALLRQIELPLKRDEDNYVISDHGSDSEAEEAAEEKDRSHKHVPKWCETYLQDLAGQSDVDPDTIFGNTVPRCMLEDIFTDVMYQEVGKSRPKRTRGSSGDWRKDRLAKHEIRDYKLRMGQVRSWDSEKPTVTSGSEPAARH